MNPNAFMTSKPRIIRTAAEAKLTWDELLFRHITWMYNDTSPTPLCWSFTLMVNERWGYSFSYVNLNFYDYCQCRVEFHLRSLFPVVTSSKVCSDSETIVPLSQKALMQYYSPGSLNGEGGGETSNMHKWEKEKKKNITDSTPVSFALWSRANRGFASSLLQTLQQNMSKKITHRHKHSQSIGQ